MWKILFNVTFQYQECTLRCFIPGSIRPTSNSRPSFPQTSTFPFRMLGLIYYTSQVTLNSVQGNLQRRSRVSNFPSPYEHWKCAKHRIYQFSNDDLQTYVSNWSLIHNESHITWNISVFTKWQKCQLSGKIEEEEDACGQNTLVQLALAHKNPL
jgi:hypothetical protein